jgi:hypothetical protein
MQQKSKNRIRVILFLFLFGFMLFSSGLGLTLRGINHSGIIGLLMTVVGVLCFILAIHLVKKHWY